MEGGRKGERERRGEEGGRGGREAEGREWEDSEC